MIDWFVGSVLYRWLIENAYIYIHVFNRGINNLCNNRAVGVFWLFLPPEFQCKQWLILCVWFCWTIKALAWNNSELISFFMLENSVNKSKICISKLCSIFFFSLRQKSTPTTEFVTWIRWQKNWLMLFVKYNFQWGYVREANYTIYDHRVFICITIWNYNTYNTHISANM